MANLNYTPVLNIPNSTSSTDYRTKLASVLGQSTPNMSVAPVSAPQMTPVNTVVAPTTSYKAPVTTTAPSTTGGYAVKAGDSLSKIAQNNGMTLAQLLDLNPVYKANPNLVTIGANINLGGGSNPAPTVTAPTTVTNPQNPQNVAPTDAQSLAERAAAAGYSPEQYANMLSTQNSVTKEESDAIARELGIPLVEGELFKKPSQTSQQLYEQAYSTSGLSDIKAKIQAIDDSIAQDRAELTDAIGKIDENPFLVETSRVGRGKRVLEQAERTINNKLTQRGQYQDLYNSGINEINNMVTRNQSDFNTDQTINTAKLNYLQKKAEQQIGLLKESKLKTATDSNIGSYLSGASSAKAPTVIGNSESGFFKYDSATKKFVQVVNAAPKKSTTSSTDGLTQTEINKNQANDIAEAIIRFKDKVTNQGFYGIDPSEYTFYRDYLRTTYGASAVTAYDKAIADAQLEVDTAGDGVGGN